MGDIPDDLWPVLSCHIPETRWAVGDIRIDASSRYVALNSYYDRHPMTGKSASIYIPIPSLSVSHSSLSSLNIIGSEQKLEHHPSHNLCITNQITIFPIPIKSI